MTQDWPGDFEYKPGKHAQHLAATVVASFSFSARASARYGYADDHLCVPGVNCNGLLWNQVASEILDVPLEDYAYCCATAQGGSAAGACILQPTVVGPTVNLPVPYLLQQVLQAASQLLISMSYADVGEPGNIDLQVEEYLATATGIQPSDVAALFIGINDYLLHNADPSQVCCMLQLL